MNLRYKATTILISILLAITLCLSLVVSAEIYEDNKNLLMGSSNAQTVSGETISKVVEAQDFTDEPEDYTLGESDDFLLGDSDFDNSDFGDSNFTLGMSEIQTFNGTTGNTIESINGLIAPADKGKVAIIPVNGGDIQFFEFASGKGIRDAVWYLYENGNNDDYVLYIGNTGASTTAVNNQAVSSTNATVFADSVPASPTQSNVTFKALEGKVGTLTITGSMTDPTTSGTTPPGGATGLTGLSEASFGTSTILRNIRLNYNNSFNMYANGHPMVLDHGFHSSVTSTNIYGGAKSGDITGGTNLTVNSTNGYAGLSIYGGSASGNIAGDVNLTINSISDYNITNIYGGSAAYTASSPNTIDGDVNLTIHSLGNNLTINMVSGGGGGSKIDGNVTTTINHTNSRISTYHGGTYTATNSANPYTPVITGGVKNTVQMTNSPSYTYAGVANFYGGSSQGTIGTQGMTQPAISTYFDSSLYSTGTVAIPFVGGNHYYAMIYGDIENTVKAGNYANGSIGSYDGVNNNDSYTGFAIAPATGIAQGAEATRDQFVAQSRYQVYGNVTNTILSGNVGRGQNYLRGGPYHGYVKGNIYTTLGTQGVVYSTVTIPSTELSNSNVVRGYNTGTDWVGGGGYPGFSGTSFIEGNTTLHHVNSVYRWTYGGNFSGFSMGNSTAIMDGGVVDTLEGSGYMEAAQWGNSQAIVNGGQVDWFLAGAGWYGNYVSGDVHVEVHDGMINSHIGGSYATVLVDGNSDVLITGGDLSGTPRTGESKKLAAGPSYSGTIAGNANFTIDLRGSTHFVPPSSGAYLSGGRAYGANNSTILGTDASNTIELNIYTDPGSDLLNGVTIYGDGGTPASNTRSGQMTINIDAPDSKIGAVYASQYTIVNNNQLIRNVDINLFQVEEIGALSGGSQTDNFTNSLKNSTNQVTMNFIGDPNSETKSQTQVGSYGIYNFHTMNIENYDIQVKNGSIKNGYSASASNRDNYHQFGAINLMDQGSFGVSGLGIITAGTLNVSGDTFITSPSGKNIINISDINFTDDAMINWDISGASTPVSFNGSWFGNTQGYYVFTFSPEENRPNAAKITPYNLVGTNSEKTEYYVGDNDIQSSTSAGYGMAVLGTKVTYNVEQGDGWISHNLEGVKYDGSTTNPSTTLTGVASAPAGTKSKSGWIIFPSTTKNVSLTYTPNPDTYSWIEQITVDGLDGYNVTIPEQTNYDPYVQVFEGYGNYDSKAWFKNTPEVFGNSVVITSSEAQALTSVDQLVDLMGGSGRPIFEHNISGQFAQIQSGLGESEAYRIHDITFSATNQIKTALKEVQLYIVPDSAVIDESRQYVLWSQDTTLTIVQAQEVANQADLDNYTRAYYLDVATGTMGAPTIDPSAIGNVNTATAPKTVAVEYSYSGLSTTSVVTIVPGAPEFVSTPPNLDFGTIQNKGVPSSYPLVSDATLSVKDERPAGSTWSVTLTSETLTSGTDTIPASVLVYIDGGTEYLLSSGYTVFSGASILGTPVQTKTWTPTDTDDTIRLSASGTETPGDYEGVLRWSLNYTP